MNGDGQRPEYLNGYLTPEAAPRAAMIAAVTRSNSRPSGLAWSTVSGMVGSRPGGGAVPNGGDVAESAGGNHIAGKVEGGGGFAQGNEGRAGRIGLDAETVGEEVASEVAHGGGPAVFQQRVSQDKVAAAIEREATAADGGAANHGPRVVDDNHVAFDAAVAARESDGMEQNGLGWRQGVTGESPVLPLMMERRSSASYADIPS